LTRREKPVAIFAFSKRNLYRYTAGQEKGSDLGLGMCDFVEYANVA
jgi:hypothetical protein